MAACMLFSVYLLKGISSNFQQMRGGAKSRYAIMQVPKAGRIC